MEVLIIAKSRLNLEQAVQKEQVRCQEAFDHIVYVHESENHNTGNKMPGFCTGLIKKKKKLLKVFLLHLYRLPVVVRKGSET